MEGGDADLGEIAGEQLSALFGDLEALADEVVRAGRADAEDDLGRDELQLLLEPGTAGRNLDVGGWAIVRLAAAPIASTAFHGVGDVHV